MQLEFLSFPLSMKQGNAGMVTPLNSIKTESCLCLMLRAFMYHALILTFAPDYLFDYSFSKPDSSIVKPDYIFWIYTEVFLKSG